MLKKFVALCFILLPLSLYAEQFVAGKDYEIIGNATEKQTTGKVRVTEFFSYGCPWCYRIEPNLSNWVKKNAAQIEFRRIPVVFHKDWLIYAKAYYTANLLGLGEKLNPLLFKTIQDDKQPLNTNESMITFFTSQGVDNSTAKSAFDNSTTVEMRVNEGLAMMSRYRIQGVPAIIVNQQYKTDLQLAKSEERMFKIIDFLVNKSHEQA